MSHYDSMMRACMDGLEEYERREINAGLLDRIVRICADVAVEIGDSRTPPTLQHIKAWSLRVGDTVWMPESENFATAKVIRSDDVGLLRVEFGHDITHWYASEDVVQIPVHRALAERWNERHRHAGATPTS